MTDEQEALALAIELLTESVPPGLREHPSDAAAVMVNVGDLRRVLRAHHDLLSRLGCCNEATYWDRPYQERIAAIRGMCDLTTNGMTPVGSSS